MRFPRKIYVKMDHEEFDADGGPMDSGRLKLLNSDADSDSDDSIEDEILNNGTRVAVYKLFVRALFA